jgi:hypothetical protein
MARRWKALGAALAASALLAASTALAAPSSEPGFSKKTAIPVIVGGNASVNSGTSTNTVTRPKCGDLDNGNGHAVWFKFTATTSQDLTADTAGSEYDTVLDVYQRGKFLGCNDDDFSGSLCGSVDRCSTVGFFATAGRTYYFRVAAFSTTPGDNTLLSLKTN